MRYGTSEDVIRIRVLPQEATEVAEWAGLMLSELVGSEVSEEGAPVRLRDPERAAELLELLMLCAEEGADASSALEPAIKLCEAAEALPPADLEAQGQALLLSAVQEQAATGIPVEDSQSIDWHPYYGSGAPGFTDSEERPAYRSSEEREDVLLAVRFGASALIDLARSQGMEVPAKKPAAGARPSRRPWF